MKTRSFHYTRHLILILAAFVGFTYCLSVPTHSAGPVSPAGLAVTGLAATGAASGGASANGERTTKVDEGEIWKEMTAGMPSPGLPHLGLPLSGPGVTATKSHSPTGPFQLGATINYTIVIDSTVNATGLTFTDTPDPNTTLVAGSVSASPVAVNDGPYNCTGNLSISIPAASGVLANDYLGLNPTATISASTAALNGTVVLAADGSFTYSPNAGYVGKDSFTYTLSNIFGGHTYTSTATVSITVQNRIWFIDDTASACTTAGSCGTLAHPFSSLSSFITAAVDTPVTANTDVIFIYHKAGAGSYSGNLTLKTNTPIGNSEVLIGQGDDLVTTLGLLGSANFAPQAAAFTLAPNGPTLPGAISNPTLTGTLTLASGVTAVAFNINTTLSTGGITSPTGGSPALTGVFVGDTSPTSTNGVNVTSTTGTAVSLDNVGGIFTFFSISANGNGGGNTTGISLVSMTGSFTVTGDGSTANSGGTIQHETGSGSSGQGVGLYMNNVMDGTQVSVSLSFMHFHDFGNFAIQGASVTNFSLSNVTIDGSNGTSAAADEASVQFTNLTGTSSIENCTISGGVNDTLELIQDSGALGLTISGCTISQTTAGGNDAVDISSTSSSTATLTLTVTNNKFTAATQECLDVGWNASGNLSTTVTGNTFGTSSTQAHGGLSIADAGSGNMTFDIETNTLLNVGQTVTPFSVFKEVPTPVVSTTATGKIIGNTIGTKNVPGSGSAVNGASSGLEVDCDGKGTMTVLIENNAVHGWDEFGLVVVAEEGSATLNATVIGNTIDTPNNGSGGLSEAGLWFDVGGEGPPDSNQVCLHVGDVFATTASQKNNITTSASGVFDIELDELAPATAIFFPTYTGAATDGGGAQGDLTAYLEAHNNLNDSGQQTIFGGGNDNFHNTAGSADCPQPPLMFVPGGIEPDAINEFGPVWRSNTPILDRKSLDFIVKAAKQRWQKAGLTKDQLALLDRLKFGITDLGDAYLGSSGADYVVFDRKGAGHGWFVDPTPLDDKAFPTAASPTLLYADTHGAPAGHIDLLTAVMHEMGHRLGLPDTSASLHRDSIMYEALSVGERRLPAKADSARVSRDPAHGQVSALDEEDVLRAVKGKNENQEEVKKAVKLSDSVLNWMAQAAITRWQLAGASPEELERMHAATLEAAEFKDDKLAVTTSTKIRINADAAGYGWFVDATPQDDSKFALPIFNREFQADLDSPAFGKIDLLTALMHAYGVVAGKEADKAVDTMQAWLMKPWLPTGVRRLPNAAAANFKTPTAGQQTETEPQADVSRRKSGLTPQSGGSVSVPVGSLPAEDSVTITFNATVNSPLTSPSTATSVSNTGQVSGTNFTTVNTVGNTGTADTAQLCVPAVDTTPISNQTVAVGGTATFTTTVTGSAPFGNFVWKQNGTILTNGSLSGRVSIPPVTNSGNSTTATLTITGALATDAGTYTVAMTDACSVTPGFSPESATLTVVSPPTITKSFNPTTIPLGGVSTITLTITNPNAGTQLTGVNFSDNFTPGSGLQVANPAGIGSTCSGTWNATPGDTFLNFGGGTLPAGSSCSLTVNVTSTKAGIINNATNAPQSNEGGTGVASNTATLTVIAPPIFTKSFVIVNQIAPSPIGANESGATVTVTTNLPHGFLTGQTVFVSGVGVAGYNGTYTIATVPSPTTFTYTDTNTGLAASGGGTATVAESTMPLNGVVTLAFTLTNPNPSTALTGVAFTDALPSGLQVAATPNASAPCGTFSPNAGDTTLTFSGGTLAASGACIVSVNVTATTPGLKSNTTGNVMSVQGGTGGTASASIVVLSPPSISKAFGAANISPGGTTTLTFTITNPNASAQLVGVAFTDALPAGLAVAATPGASTSCGGTFAPNPADTTLNFTGGTIAAAGACTISVNVTAVSSGTKNNTTGAVTSANAGTGNTASASIGVALPPTISKAFALSSIPVGGTTTLTFTLTNPNLTQPLTGVGFTDTLPAGLSFTTPSTTTASGGTLTVTTSSLSLTGAMLAANSAIQISLSVTGVSPGLQNNTTSVITSNEGGTGANSNTATITVVGPPTINKQFDLISQIAASPTGATESGSTVTITTTAPHNFVTGQTVTIAGVGVAGYNGTFTIASVPTATRFTYTDTNTGLAASGGGTATVNITSMPLNAVATLVFRLTNPNAGTSLTGVSFTDALPSGLQVAATPNASAPCGTFSPNPGDTTLAFSGGTLAASATCIVSVNITGTTPGVKNNITGAVTSNEGGTGTTASASITVVSPPSISKAFGAANIPLNGTTTLTFTITNPNTTAQLTGVGFTDSLPSGLQVASTPGASASCGGTFAPTAGATTLTFSGGTIAASGTCTVTVNVTGTTGGVKNNTTGNVISNEGGAGNTGSATLSVASAPTITKTFGASSVLVGGTTSLTFTITNPNTTQGLTGVSFTDTLPAGLTVPNGTAATCGGGTVTTSASAGTITLTGGAIAASGNCSFSVTVTGATAGVWNNTTGAISSNESGTGATSNTATLTVIAPPSISKSFGNATIPLNGTSVLTFTVTNPNTTTTLTGVAFTDSLPSGLTVASGSSSTCGGGTLTTTAPGAISVSGGSIAPSSNCTILVTVTGATAGVKNNTTGAVSSTNGGTGTTSNTATITVLAPPTISKSFTPSTIALGGTSTLTFTLTNPNSTVSLTGVGFTDTLPAGVTVATSSVSECGGTLTTTSPSTVSYSGGTIGTGGSNTCTFSVTVTGATGGIWNNTTGAVTSTNGGTGTTSNTATLTVASPPSISKSFGASSIPVGGTTTLSFTITNPNTTQTLTGVGFTDALPSGLQVAATPNASASCGGTFAPNPGDTTLTFSGGAIGPAGSCTVVVTVTGTTPGVKNNTTGNVVSNEGGTGNTASASITVVGPPTIAKQFDLISQIAASPTGATESGSTVTITTTSPHDFLTGESATIAGVGVAGYNGTFTIASVPSPTTFTYTDTNTGLAASGGGTATVNPSEIPLGGTATLVFTLTNPNATTSLTGISFSDALPSGLQVATTPNASAPCGTFLPNAGDTTLNFSAGTIAASGSCTVSVNVTATTAGVKNNTTGAITSNEGGTGLTASASVTVVGPPSITKAFGSANIALNGTTTLTFTITNPNPTAQLTGVGFTDSLPAGLQVASTPGASASCGGTFTPSAGATTLTFSGGTISAGGACTLVVNVTGTTAGVKNNTTGNVTSNEGGSGNTGSATLTVASAPTISKTFGSPNIALGTTTTLTFTITNPNSTLGLTGVTFTDALPAGITVATGTASTCGGGTVTTTAPGTITLTGGALPASGNCSFTVTVTGASAGVWNNTTGPISSNESGAGTTSNTATLTVVAPPSISKSFDASTIPMNGTSVLTFTITNSNTTTTLTGVSVTDLLPSGLTVTSGTSSTCGGGTLTTTAPGTISLTGASIAPSSNCQFTVTVTGTTAGVKTNTTGAVSSTNGGTGTTSNTAIITVLGPPTISKAFGASNIPLNGTTSLTFTITNPNSTVALTGVGFTDTLPSGLTVATSSTSEAGGTLTTTAGTGVIQLTGATVAAGSNIQFSVTVTGATAGVWNNTTGAVTSTNGGAGTTSNTATLNVASPPTISKAFGASSIPVGGTTSLSFNIINTNASLAITGVAFTDTLPAGLTVASGTMTTCGGGTVTLTAPSTIALTGGSIAPNFNCSFRVTVTGVSAGVQNNTTGAISSTQSGTGTTSNTATLTVLAAPTITKAFSGPTVPLNGTTTVTFTVTNPNATMALTGVSFSDSLPAGLKVASTPAVVNNLGGTVTATAGGSSISLTGGTVPSGGSATLSVNLTGVTAGVDNNTTGNVNSGNGGMGATSNTATITVLAPPTISKAFGATIVPPGQTTSLTFTLTNPNSTVALTGVGFTDNFPAGLEVATPPGASDPCGGTFTATAGATSVSLTDGTIPAGGTCVITVTVEVTPTSGGTMTNVITSVTSANGGTGGGSAPVTISSFDKCLHDDTTQNFIQFSSVTGNYLFTHCGTGAFTLSGQGTITTPSGMLVITDKETGKSVTIDYNTGSLIGTAVITISTGQGTSATYHINDTNPHPTCTCAG
jgi:fimbrial isopeptide formation D2 family protein/uncharacterized repeat protein (TIGR01451 family)